jgi:hypothetical protein
MKLKKLSEGIRWNMNEKLKKRIEKAKEKNLLIVAENIYIDGYYEKDFIKLEDIQEKIDNNEIDIDYIEFVTPENALDEIDESIYYFNEQITKLEIKRAEINPKIINYCKINKQYICKTINYQECKYFKKSKLRPHMCESLRGEHSLYYCGNKEAQREAMENEDKNK